MSLTLSPAPHTVSVTAQIASLNAQTTLPVLARLFLTVAVVVTKWDRAYRSRRALKRLDTDQLHDIGLTRSSAQAEADKPFWQD